MTDSACRHVRELLGVYVLGAIDPADRAITDEHLSSCVSCREELAGLAPLPALLRRVPVAEAEQLAAMDGAQDWGGELRAIPGGVDSHDGTAEGLQSLLAAVRARRRAGRLRAVLALAAAVILAAGGAAVITHQLQPHSVPVVRDIAEGSHDGVTAWITYEKATWGTTELLVRVTGIRAGTTCTLWVVNKQGQRWAASAWTVQPGGAGPATYPAVTSVPAAQLESFQIRAHGHLLVTVPASD